MIKKGEHQSTEHTFGQVNLSLCAVVGQDIAGAIPMAHVDEVGNEGSKKDQAGEQVFQGQSARPPRRHVPHKGGQVEKD